MQTDITFNIISRHSTDIESVDFLDAANDIDQYWNTQRDLNDPGGWDYRYKHEQNIINNVIQTHKIKTILELGCGPGGLADKILTASPDLIYHMVDGKSACDEHTRRNYKGAFFVKDLKYSFEHSDLNSDYDLIITNDFLEHITNPSLILSTVYDKLTGSDSYYFCSSPNWRTKHEFYYPGLFDYDNLVKFFRIHKFELIAQFPSWATHVPIRTERLHSEQIVAQDKLFDWNYYLLFKKI